MNLTLGEERVMPCKAVENCIPECLHVLPRFPQFPQDPQNAAEHMFGSWNMWRSPSLLEAQAVLDGRGRGVYVSEFATWDTTITTWPSGNLKVGPSGFAVVHCPMLRGCIGTCKHA